MARPVTMMDVRAALRDDRFLDMFPELDELVMRFKKQKHCGSCGVELARQVIEQFPDRVRLYFPGRDVLTPAQEVSVIAGNERIQVINCHVDELEAKLRKQVTPGVKKFMVPARDGDQITVIIHYPGYVEAS